MPVQHPSLVRFNGGQWSEKLRARSDLEDYDSSLELMNGFIPLKYGEAQAMTGFKFGTDTKTDADDSVLIPFQYSSTDSFWLELGDLHMRFIYPATGLYVESAPDVPLEIVTPYAIADVYDIQYQNLNDLVVLTHGSYPPQEVTRVTDTSWTITEYVQDWPAFLSENLERDHFIAPDNTTGAGVVLSATGSGNEPFDSDMIGGYFALSQKREAISNNYDLEATFLETGIKAKGDWTLKTDIENVADIGTGTLTLRRSDDDGATYYSIFTVTFLPGYSGFDVSGTVDEDDVLFEIQLEGTPATWRSSVSLNIEGSDIAGYGTITDVTNSTTATITVVEDFESLTKTNKFREGGWSDHQGYPKASTHFEQRMFFGGTTKKPTAIWASATDDISNFDFRTTDASDAFHRVIDNSQNAIQWMSRKDKVFIGTAGEEFVLSSSNEQEAITPSNVTVKTSGGNGSAPIKPISLGSSLAFVTLNKIQLREMSFDATTGKDNSDIDLTELADSITGTGIKQVAYQQYPNRTLYMIRDDGVLLGLVYDKKNSISGWFTRETDGLFKSVVSTRSGSGVNDPLGVVVARTIDGVTKRSIETLAAPTDTNTDWVYLDSAIQVLALGSTTVTGADHLEGETVRVMNDGALETNKTVTGGTFELDRSSTTSVVYGLDYDAEFITLPVQVNTGDGNSKIKPKSATHVMLGVRKSLSGQYGYKGVDDKGDSVTAMDTIYPIDTGDRVMGTAQDPVTRYYKLPLEGGHWREYSLRIVRNNPVPLNVTHAIPAIEASGD